jgi:hypothetical protein
MTYPIAGQVIRCHGSIGMTSRASERRIYALPGATSVYGEYQSSAAVRWINSFHPYSPPQLFGLSSTSYAALHLSDALGSLRSIPGIFSCASTLIRGMEDATTGMSSGGVSAEMGIGLPRNATEESLYCAATSRAAVSQGMAELHRNFPGFNAQRL